MLAVMGSAQCTWQRETNAHPKIAGLSQKNKQKETQCFPPTYTTGRPGATLHAAKIYEPQEATTNESTSGHASAYTARHQG